MVKGELDVTRSLYWRLRVAQQDKHTYSCGPSHPSGEDNLSREPLLRIRRVRRHSLRGEPVYAARVEIPISVEHSSRRIPPPTTASEQLGLIRSSHAATISRVYSTATFGTALPPGLSPSAKACR